MKQKVIKSIYSRYDEEYSVPQIMDKRIIYVSTFNNNKTKKTMNKEEREKEINSLLWKLDDLQTFSNNIYMPSCESSRNSNLFYKTEITKRTTILGHFRTPTETASIQVNVPICLNVQIKDFVDKEIRNVKDRLLTLLRED